MPVGTVVLIVLLVLAVIGGAIVFAMVKSSAPARADKRRVQELEALVDQLRELAYDHRELDSTLAPIIIDEIRSFERRSNQRRELS